MRLLCFIVVFVFAVVELSCSASKNKGSENVDSKDELGISAKQLYAWLNLMPGDKPRFHLSGSLEVENKSTDTIRSLKMREVKVFQDGREFYSFDPKIMTAPDYHLLKVMPGEKRSFHFTDGTGFRTDSSFNADIPVKAEISFLRDNDTAKFFSNEIKIERVY